jgi:pyruvate/2-oxoglutarate dehydrogenase complex dihydrolipoamide dehydrogenase (E3) component
LIATGTNIAVNGISGIDTVNCWSPDTALRMAKLPKVLLVVGGGSTGCELAEYFGALGVKVLMIEAQDRILPREDPEASGCQQAFTRSVRRKDFRKFARSCLGARTK